MIKLRIHGKMKELPLDDLFMHVMRAGPGEEWKSTTKSGEVYTFTPSQEKRILTLGKSTSFEALDKRILAESKIEAEEKQIVEEIKFMASGIDFIEGPMSGSEHRGLDKIIYIFGDIHGLRDSECKTLPALLS